MNHPLSILASMQAVFFLAPSASAQTVLPSDMKGQKNGMKVACITRGAIGYMPLTIKTLIGRDLKPTDKLTLPNGQSVVVSDYLTSVNALEQKLNQIGYSIKTGPRTETITQATVDPSAAATIQADLDSKIAPGITQGLKYGVDVAPASPIALSIGDYDTSRLAAKDRATLASSIAAFNAKGVKADTEGGYVVNFSQLSALNGKDVLAGVTSGLGRVQSKPKPLPPAQDVPYNDTYNYTWTHDMGFFSLAFKYSSGYVGLAHVTPQKTVDYKKSTITASMSGDFSVAAFMVFPIDILKFDAAFVGGGPNGESLKADVYLGGNKIFSKSDHESNGGTVSDSAGLPFDEEASAVFPIAPGIFILGKAGINGAVGITYKGTLYSSSVHVKVTPFVKAAAYVEAAVAAGFEVQGVNAGIDAGLKCNVLLVNERVELGCNVGLAYDGRTGIQEEIYVKNKIDALSGKIDGFIDIPFIHTYNFNVYNWGGVHQDKTLYDHKFFTPLNVTLTTPSSS